MSVKEVGQVCYTYENRKPIPRACVHKIDLKRIVVNVDGRRLSFCSFQAHDRSYKAQELPAGSYMST